MSSKLPALLTIVSALSIATSSQAQINVPTNQAVRPPLTTAGGNLKGEYWKRPVNSIPTDGATSSTNRIDNLINGFGTPSGTFQATRFVYLGNDLTHVTNWLAGDAGSFVGATNNLDDGVFRFSGFINITNAGTVRLGTTSDDGSRIRIAGIDVINNDGSHGDATVDTNVVFAAAGLYPIEITFFNGDWTSDGTGARLNHSGNPDPSVHGGANFHLRVAGADVTPNRAGMFYSSAPLVYVPGKLAVSPPQTSGGGTLKGQYWKRPAVSIPTDGATNPTNRIDTLINGFGRPNGTFRAREFVYLGNDLTPITNWLAGDAASFVGTTNNLDDGAIRLSGFINVATPGTVNLGTTSDEGSRITIGGLDIINNDGSHNDVTMDTNVVFVAAGLYPIEITYFNGDWTSDGTGANLNHSGNPDPSVHGGANFHLRVTGADVTTNLVTMFFPVAPAGALPAELGQTVNGFQDDFTGATRDPDWQPFGPGGDRYEQADGLLYVSTSVGDPNHLLYMKPGYSNDVQEVLARIRVTAFQASNDFPRGGLAVGVQTNTADVSRGLDLHFRAHTNENVAPQGRQFKFLDDLRSWGPAGLRTNIPPQTTPGWTNNVWYWQRLRLDPKADKTNSLYGKVWVADGATPEPADWQLKWPDSAIPKPLRKGFAGIAGSSADASGNG